MGGDRCRSSPAFPMPTTISIPRDWMGTTLQDAEVKAGLREMQPDLHFDMGVCLGIWHPYQECRQNVFYRGKSVGAMDRGTLPEVPIWSMRKDVVEVPESEVRPGELALYRTANVIGLCLCCRHKWELPFRPLTRMACPKLCGNAGASTDEKRFSWENKPTGTAFVYRSEKDRVILVGWRHTFWRILGAKVPGVTKDGLERRFRVNLDEKPLHEIEVLADVEARFLDRKVEVS